MKLDKLLHEKVLILDGAMGTEIIKRTREKFAFPEILNLERKEIILDIHRAYIEAGADIITTNSFGATQIKLNEYGAGRRVEELNTSAAELAKKARKGGNILIAGSMGPTGKLIKPLGEVDEEEVYNSYAEQAKALERGGVDFLLIETQIDILEAKIAFIASKENTNLPLAISFSYPLEDGMTLTGSTPEIAAVTFSSTDIDIFGINCGGDPEDFEKIIKKISSHTDKPLLVYANAGIPEKRGNLSSYSIGPEAYIDYAKSFYKAGASIIGGCCGTTPSHINLIAKELKGKKPIKKKKRLQYFSCSSRNSLLSIGPSFPFRIIGENINPFGRKKLNAELEQGKFTLARESARKQEQKGADALDVNLGKRGERDAVFYASAIKELQITSRLPLFLDNSSKDSLNLALRSYAGKAVINSVNAQKKIYEVLFPLAKKYGSSVILLAIDENGIPERAKDRVKMLENLYQQALNYGLSPYDILADPVTLTLSVSSKNAEVTLKTIGILKNLRIPTIIGLSNISFGLPRRQLLNSCFLSMALERGLDSAIFNPLDTNLMSIIKACDAITGRDKGMHFFIEKFGSRIETEAEEKVEIKTEYPEKLLFHAIIDGEKKKARQLTKTLLEKGKKGFDIIEGILSPALKQVGKYYENKIYFLPQLILSAEAMEGASKIIEPFLKTETRAKKKIKILMATVHGDLHDIGKKIISLIFQNYGFDVLDLGKDVSSEDIIDSAIKESVDFIGLSSLMTTTMEEMRKVVELRDLRGFKAKIIIGGAAVTSSYAREIGADAYGKDAMDAIKKIEKLSGGR